MQTQPLTTTRRRIHQIYVLPSHLTAFEVFVSMIGLVLWLVLLSNFLNFGSPVKSQSAWAGIVAYGVNLLRVIITIAPGLLAMFWVYSRSKRNAQLRMGRRFQRLSHVVAHPDAMQRLPHRVVEHAVSGSPFLYWALRKVARKLPPGQFIVCRDPKSPRLQTIEPIRVPFEPVDMRNDKDRMIGLAEIGIAEPETTPSEMNSDSSHSGSESEEMPEQHPRKPKPRRRSNAVLKDFINLLFFSFWVGVLTHKFVRLLVGPNLMRTPVTAILVALCVFVFILGVRYWNARNNSTYLIPRGFAVRRSSHLGRSAVVQQLNPDNTSVLAMRGPGKSSDDAVLILQCTGKKPIATTTDLNIAIAVWLSTAPTPTQAQLELLLDPKA